MNLDELYGLAKEFSKETHGSSNYDQDRFYIQGNSPEEFVPLSFLKKKTESVGNESSLMAVGFVSDSLDLFSESAFQKWFERQFSQKLKRSVAKKIIILHMPHNKAIFDSIEMVNKSFSILRQNNIILNGKNLPVQLGEWYAKCVFGLHQIKSASQRGFDFYLDETKVEVRVHWSDTSSPKGVKIRKSLVDLSEHCIIMYIARNFMIREICFLDSAFVKRKFSGKGHTVFLKDSDVSQYFFSNSTKHMSKVVNRNFLLKYANPTLATRLVDESED